MLGSRRPHEQQCAAGLAGRNLKALARLEVQLDAEGARDGRGHARAQGFLGRPEGILLVGGLDEDDAAGVEAKRVEAVAEEARIPEGSTRGEDEDKRGGARRAGEKRDQKSERGRHIRFGLGGDLVQGAEGEAAAGKISVERGKPERQAIGLAALHPFNLQAFDAGQHAAQPAECFGARGGGFIARPGGRAGMRGLHQRLASDRGSWMGLSQ